MTLEAELVEEYHTQRDADGDEDKDGDNSRFHRLGFSKEVAGTRPNFL